MSAVLATCLKDIVQKVETLSGKKVKLIEKRGMSVPVVAKVAKADMPAHLLYLDRTQNDLAYHAIAHECVHILRLFEVADDKKIVPIATPEMRENALDSLDEDIMELSSAFSDDNIKKMCDFWYDSIIRQLTNFPPDIMVEKWLYKYYPELRPVQMQAIKQQAEFAIGGLQREVRELTPEIIYQSANTMNYTYFHILGKHFELELDAPFQNTHFEKEGQKLVAITEDGYQDNYEGDIAMIHLWAQFLGLADWFAWIDLQSVPG